MGYETCARWLDPPGFCVVQQLLAQAVWCWPATVLFHAAADHAISAASRDGVWFALTPS